MQFNRLCLISEERHQDSYVIMCDRYARLWLFIVPAPLIHRGNISVIIIKGQKDD